MGFAFPFDCPFRGGGGAKEYLIDGLFFGGRGGCFIAYRLTKLVESFSLKRRDRRKKLSILALRVVVGARICPKVESTVGWKSSHTTVNQLQRLYCIVEYHQPTNVSDT